MLSVFWFWGITPFFGSLKDKNISGLWFPRPVVGWLYFLKHILAVFAIVYRFELLLVSVYLCTCA